MYIYMYIYKYIKLMTIMNSKKVTANLDLLCFSQHYNSLFVENPVEKKNNYEGLKTNSDTQAVYKRNIKSRQRFEK